MFSFTGASCKRDEEAQEDLHSHKLPALYEKGRAIPRGGLSARRIHYTRNLSTATAF